MLNKKYSIIWLALLVLGVIVVWILNEVYTVNKIRLETSAMAVYEQKLYSEIDALVAEKRKSSMSIALTLSENPVIAEFLCSDCENAPQTPLNLNRLINRFSTYTDFKQLWVQVINSQGVSKYRSWTPKKEDSLLEARKDIVEVLENPKITQSLSVGKFTLAFKSIVPIRDEAGKLLGLVEIISQFSSLTKRLKSLRNIDSVVLVSNKYSKQFSRAETGVFLDNHYVVNGDSTAENLKRLKLVSASDFSAIDGFLHLDDVVIGKYPIKNEADELLGWWFTFTLAEQIDLAEVEYLMQQVVYGFVLLIFLLLLLVALYYFKRRSDALGHYYRQILDSASEMIFVVSEQRIIEVNRHFFEFYDEFETLQAFLSKYTCVSDTFEEEDGFLQRQVSGAYWLKYVVSNPDKLHKAKIIKHGQVHYFAVKASVMKGVIKPLYNVIFLDITDQEVYKNKLEHLSLTDALTGVGNRLFFNQNIVKEIQRSHRYQSDLSLLMFDIDFFKKVNDSYGHDVGDQVLIELASQIKAHLRDTDILCRYGGEEFMIILPETSLEEALKTAEKLRLAIEQLASDVLPMQLTISFGVAQMTRWDSEKTLLKRVDNVLYRAKEMGRNRVEKATE